MNTLGEKLLKPPGLQGYRRLRVVIAGGGTGGHIFPGIAIARAFSARNAGTRILFVGTGNKVERLALEDTPFAHSAVPAQGIKGRGLGKQLFALLKIPYGILCAVDMLRKFRADMVVGVGGYSSGPVVMGAFLMGIPIVLQEQNLLPGMANRVLGRLAKRIYVSFENTAPVFKAEKVRVTGNPVRPEIALPAARSSRPAQGGGVEGRFTVLICGGSQGAHGINQAVMAALPYLQHQPVNVIHQTGAMDVAAVRSAYDAHGVKAHVSSFFKNMAEQYAEAQLVVCRAGATTVAELTAMGKPVIFIPFPHAADNHQALNAQSLVDAGAAAIVLEKNLDGKVLADLILYYAGHPAVLAQMASRSRQLGRPEAADDIVEDCYRILS